MNIDANIEIKRRDNKIDINIFSDNNGILIGKNGRTMKALQNILKQIVSTKIAEDIYITLDVSDYKEKRNRRICSLAKRIAREVAKTKIETSLDNMNSYERRLVHSTLADNKYVYTVSVGEEPLRHVVIKPKEE